MEAELVFADLSSGWKLPWPTPSAKVSPGQVQQSAVGAGTRVI